MQQVVQLVEIPRLAQPATDEPAAFFGRYRLWFDQIAPKFSSYWAMVTIRTGYTELVASVVDDLDAHGHWPFHVCGDVLRLELLADVPRCEVPQLRVMAPREARNLRDSDAAGIGDLTRTGDRHADTQTAKTCPPPPGTRDPNNKEATHLLTSIS